MSRSIAFLLTVLAMLYGLLAYSVGVHSERANATANAIRLVETEPVLVGYGCQAAQGKLLIRTEEDEFPWPCKEIILTSVLVPEGKP